jgi:hypothetical protein
MAIQHGDSKMRQWLLNALFSIVLAIGGMYFSSIESKHTTEMREFSEFKQQQYRADAAQDLEIAVIKAENANQKEMLQKMDKKLDEVLSRIRR